MPLALQAKLLRAIEQREVQRLGALRPRTIDVRFVSATNRDLEDESAKGRFRSDLYYRLAGVTLRIPPLRERPHEIEPLARAFVERAAAEAKRSPPSLSPAALEVLRRYPWPGNIRELRNVVERAVLLTDVDAIDVDHLQLSSS
jgi:DNA-binding NtrC family response regulator